MILGTGWGATSFLKGLDTEHYNVIVVSPKNYFLFTPLLPSTTVGTVEPRSIMEPIRYFTRHKRRAVRVIEAECTSIDPDTKTLRFSDTSEIQGSVAGGIIPYDHLVVAVGAENATFGIPGVHEFACFLKEIWDGRKIRTRLMDCLETATIPGQPEEEIDRLLHMVVVGGGPTGVEYAAELHDFLTEDLVTWYPDLSGRVRITLVEALPSVLQAFSKQLIDYTESTFKENHIDVLTKTMVKKVDQKHITVKSPDGSESTIPYGLLVWATGNTMRPLIRDLASKIGSTIQNQRRGLVVDEHLRVQGVKGIWALGDATATKYAPTAQVASQQGRYLANVFNRRGEILAATSPVTVHSPDQVEDPDLQPFHYSHEGSLAYIGSDKAIADLPFLNGNFATGGFATFLFWRSAYISTLFSLRNRCLVIADWSKKVLFGRDIGRE